MQSRSGMERVKLYSCSSDPEAPEVIWIFIHMPLQHCFRITVSLSSKACEIALKLQVYYSMSVICYIMFDMKLDIKSGTSSILEVWVKHLSQWTKLDTCGKILMKTPWNTVSLTQRWYLMCFSIFHMHMFMYTRHWVSINEINISKKKNANTFH